MATQADIDEYKAIKIVLRALNAGDFEASVSIGGMSVTYSAQKIPFLERREKVLASRIMNHNRSRMRIHDRRYI
jgi:hypothetical protein